MVKFYSKVMTLFLLCVLGGTSVVAQECPLGFKRPSYKTRSAYCSTGEYVPDAYNFGKKILCERMEVDHLIPLKLAHCAGLSDEQLKRLANDPKNLRFTLMQTNRSKGAKDLYSFVQTLDPKMQKKVLIDGVSVLTDYDLPIDSQLSRSMLKYVTNSDSALSKASQKIAGLTSQLEKTPVPKEIYIRGKKVLATDAVSEASERIAKRATASAARNLGSLPASAIPFLGVAVAVGVTTLDLKDSCDTTTELAELKQALTPNQAIEFDAEKVCGLKVPSNDDILKLMKGSPKDIWEEAKKHVSQLPEFNPDELEKQASEYLKSLIFDEGSLENAIDKFKIGDFFGKE